MRLFEITTDASNFFVYAGNKTVAGEVFEAAYPNTPIQSILDVFEAAKPGIIVPAKVASNAKRKASE